MKKNEFMEKLENELRRRNVADADDVLEEYAQHFAFKMADGYSEEEIAAKLGSPAALAAQFEQSGASDGQSGSRTLRIAGLGFVDVVAGLFFALLAAWAIVMAVASLTCAALTVCLLGGINVHGWIPPMPYGCGAVLALAFAALAVLVAAGCVYYAAFLRQLARAFGRFQHNALAGAAKLPALTIVPQLPAQAKRRLRTVALISLAVFAAFFVLSYIVCGLSAGSLQFWHAWGWFGQAGLN